MRRLYGFLGLILYWTIGYVLLWVELNKSKRTRVVIYDTTNKKVLLVKSWLSNQDWKCPGGGIKKGEEPEAGAVREIKEELGIPIKPDELQFVMKRFEVERFASYEAWYYEVHVATPAVRPHRVEILDMNWFSPKSLPKNVDKYTAKAVTDLHHMKHI